MFWSNMSKVLNLKARMYTYFQTFTKNRSKSFTKVHIFPEKVSYEVLVS